MSDALPGTAVNVLSDDQLAKFLADIKAVVTPGPSVIARAGSVVKMGGADVVAGVEKVGGEVKSYLPLIAFVTAVASIVMQLLPVVAAHIK